MNKSEIFMKELDKVLQTLNEMNIELQLDLITRSEQKLIQYKNSIQDKQKDCNSCQVFNNRPKFRSNESLDKTVGNNIVINDEFTDNLDINSDFEQNIRKSKRIYNRLTKQIESTLTEEEDNLQTRSDGKTCSDITIDSIDGQNKTSIEEQRIESLAIDSSKTKPKCGQRLEDNEKVVVKRRWRRTQDINDLKCKYCGKIWRSLSHLEIHLRTHTGEKVFECQQCGHRFSQLAGLQVHLKRHSNDRAFKCDICEKGFFTKIDLSRHKSSHKEFKQITQCCEICGKGFSDKRKVKNHIRYVHEKKESVVCEICGHKTHGQHLLYAHKRAKHGKTTKYACPVCQAVIGSRSAFVVHLRAHAEVKPCACDICGKQFRSKSQVARHMLSHREGKHECDICMKKFKTPHHLRRHEIIHSSDKPFKCQFCEYKCNVNSNVVKHVKAVHGVVGYSLRTPQTTVATVEEDALQKGSLVTQEVLKDIALTKGQKISVKELKILDQKKKREKELIIKEMEENVCQRKQLPKRKSIKERKDILDDAIASTFSDYNNHLIETPVNVSIGVNPVPDIQEVIISDSAQVYEIGTDVSQPSQPNSGLCVGDGQHIKNIITFHFSH